MRISVLRNDKIVPLLSSKPTNSNWQSPMGGLVLEAHVLRPFEVPEHEHSSFCLSLQTGPETTQEWWSDGKNGKECYQPGSLIFVTPGASHRTRWTQTSHQLVLSIEQSYVLRAAQELGCNSGLHLKNNWKFHDRQLELLLNELEREMQSGWRMGPLYHDHLGLSLSIALIHKFGHQVDIPSFSKGGIPTARLQRVLDYVAANANHDITLDDLAETAEMSRFHFARAFRVQMGMAPHRYVIEQRLQQAKILLRLTTRSLTEIAVESGFSSAGDLSRAFRRSVGVSPTEWKRSI